MRIAHFGTFDVENFGDLLFPLVLERRLAGRGHVVTHVSPIGGPPVFGDCVATISVEQARQRDFDGVVIGGGHLIHGRPSDVAAYRAAGDRALFAYAELWFGATRLACERGASLVWNAPGVPGPVPSETAALLRWAASQADYLALRDETSRGFFERAFEGQGAARGGECVDAAVVLDTAIDVAQLFSATELDRAFRAAFETRGQVAPERALALHFNARFLQDGIEATADRIGTLCRVRGLVPILLALGPCHGDGALVRALSAALAVPHLALDAPASLRELVACLRGAELYVGSSLHGGITARAFDRPAIFVAPEAPGGHTKQRSFLEAHTRAVASEADRRSAVVPSWSEAFPAVESALAAVPSACDASGPDSAEKRASDPNALHWQRLLCALEAADGDAEALRARRRAGSDALAALVAERWGALGDSIGLLLDQAREAAAFREAAQRSAERFRNLERAHRDLREALRVARAAGPRAKDA